MSDSNSTSPDGSFRDSVAKTVLVFTIAGLALLAIVLVALPFTAGRGDDKWEEKIKTGMQIFNALLPVFGTWIGTLLAFYFSKENFEAASKSVRELARDVSSGAERLKSVAASSVMIPPDKMLGLPAAHIGAEDSTIPLVALMSHLQAQKVDRLPLFEKNAAGGPPRGVVHLSVMQRFIAEQALLSQPPVMANLTLADLLVDPKIAVLLPSSFGIVGPDDTLARAKSIMDNLSQSLGPAGGCYDMFVCPGATPGTAVLGWITNDIINGLAKV